ncbi:MAG: aminoglycoside phosphotransferase family protein [Atopobiaceae bacterium]|jgi:thiamine kinase-like enzyme|nr:aminoglycoside phosphotransferase family protein [Atopobiaceae bacterium]
MKLSDSKVEVARRNNKVVYQDGDRLVKVFNERKPGSDVFNEALNNARVSEAGGRVPRVLEVSQIADGEWEGSWALALEFIPGRTLEQVIDENEANVDEYFDQFVELQLQVQSGTASLLNRQKDKLRRMINSVKSLDPSVRYELQMRLDGIKGGTKVCHGDFVPSNIIMPDDGSDPYVIDWAHVTSGIPEVDAAQTYLLFQADRPDSAEKYLTLYSKKSDTAKQVIKKWVPVVAAAELARGRHLHEDFLLSQIEVDLDYL